MWLLFQRKQRRLKFAAPFWQAVPPTNEKHNLGQAFQSQPRSLANTEGVRLGLAGS